MGVDWAAQPWPLGVLAQSPGPTTICPCRAWFPSLADEVAACPPSTVHSDVGGEIRGGGGESFAGSKCRRAITAAVPQGAGLQSRAWCLSPTQGAPPFLGGGLEQLRLLRDRPPPQLRSHQDQGLQRDQPPGTEWVREGPHRGLAQAGTPTCSPSLGRGPMLEMEGTRVGWGPDAKEGQTRQALTAHRTWASSQVAEAAFLVGCKHVGAPVSTGPWGAVGPQAALLAHPTAAGARLPRGPGGPGTVPSHTARARAQGQLCGGHRTLLSCSQPSDPHPPRPSSSANLLGQGWLCPILPLFQI